MCKNQYAQGPLHLLRVTNGPGGEAKKRRRKKNRKNFTNTVWAQKRAHGRWCWLRWLRWLRWWQWPCWLGIWHFTLGTLFTLATPVTFAHYAPCFYTFLRSIPLFLSSLHTTLFSCHSFFMPLFFPLHSSVNPLFLVKTCSIICIFLFKQLFFSFHSSFQMTLLLILPWPFF